MMVYQGTNYEWPASRSEVRSGDSLSSTPVQPGSLNVEEAKYNNLLDGLGPRYVEWWGTGVLPVNAGRNRNHQGLAAAMVKLWEKSLVAKVAIKCGIQDTNNKLMAAELKMLPGGMLLLRNKYFIAIYRGKDFLPPDVAAALSEREVLNGQIQDVEEKARATTVEAAPLVKDGQAEAGTLAEFYEAQARWGRDVSAEECEKMVEEASKSKSLRLVRRVEHKLALSEDEDALAFYSDDEDEEEDQESDFPGSDFIGS